LIIIKSLNLSIKFLKNKDAKEPPYKIFFI
jgi:hypothetical protein